MKNIEEILQLLSWSNSAEDQERGRDMAQNIEDISEYAFECLKDKAMDEVYNEYRVSKLLG